MSVTAQGKLFLVDMGRKKRLEFARAEAFRHGTSLDMADFEQMENELQNVANQGFATNFGENEAEVAAIAVPVMDAAGGTPLTLSVFGIRSSFDRELIERAKKYLLDGAATLSRQLQDRSQSRLDLKAS